MCFSSFWYTHILEIGKWKLEIRLSYFSFLFSHLIIKFFVILADLLKFFKYFNNKSNIDIIFYYCYNSIIILSKIRELL